MGRRKRWERGLVLVLALNLLFSVIPSDMVSPIRGVVQAEEYQEQMPAETHVEEGLHTSVKEEAVPTEETDKPGDDNPGAGAPLLKEEPESEKETGNQKKTENPGENGDQEKTENPGEAREPEGQKVPEVSGNDPEEDMSGEEAEPEEEPELEEEPEEEPDEYTETWEGSMTPEELGSLGEDEVGARYG